MDVNKQKIIVAKGKLSSSDYVPFEILYSEIAINSDIAKTRVKELKEEYKDIDNISISYFSK